MPITSSTAELNFGRITPLFFQPLSPQIHLRSRLEVSDLQDNVSKPLGTSNPSDSGYSSNGSGNLRVSSSSNNSNDITTPLPNFLSSSQPQPAAELVPAYPQDTWDMDNGMLDVNSGICPVDLHDTGIFDSSWLECDPQPADAWNTSLSNVGIRGPFYWDQEP